MPVYDFSVLESKFPEIVNQMPDPFDSHEFLLLLAQKYQTEYVSALYAYKDYSNKGSATPFQAVHSAIMHLFKKHSELVTLLPDEKLSKDIFGNPNNCGEWKKVN